MATQQSCKYFNLGNCKRGEDCNFIHDEVLPLERRPLCIFFTGGQCKKGAECAYRHDSKSSTQTSESATSDLVRTFHGITATFGPGVQIKNIESVEPRDHSHIRVPLLTVSWRRPGPVVYIGFNQIDHAHLAEEFLRSQPEMHGSETHVTLEKSLPCQRSEYILVLGRLPSNFEDFPHLLRDVRTRFFAEEIINESEQSVIQKLSNEMSRKLTGYGDTTHVSLLSSARNSRCTLKVQYKLMSAVRRAYHEKIVWPTHPGLSLSFHMSCMYTTRQLVRAPIMNALAEEYDDIIEDAQAFGVTIRESELDEVRGTFSLKMMSKDREELGRTKQALQRLFTGHVAMVDDKILWSSAFARASVLEKINTIGWETGVFIYRDLEAQCLRMYGPTYVCSEALADLIGLNEELHEYRKELRIKADEFPSDYNTILSHLLSTFGSQAVRMELTATTRQAKLIAWPNEIDGVKKYLTNFKRIVASDHTAACPICWGEVDEPVVLTCSHVYCKACLFSQLNSAQFPVACHGEVPHGESGNTGACGQPIALDLLRNTVKHGESFEQSLKQALIAHLKTHPLEYRACPTPDCMHWYKPVSESTHDRSIIQFEDDIDVVYICPSCFSSTCRVCALPAHPNSSCEEAVDSYRSMDRAFDRWKSRNRVQDCPKCQASIQKDGGCNHVTCLGCNTHICWFCLETFENPEEVYSHMQHVHGDDVGAEGDEDDSASEGSNSDDEEEEEDEDEDIDEGEEFADEIENWFDADEDDMEDATHYELEGYP